MDKQPVIYVNTGEDAEPQGLPRLPNWASMLMHNLDMTLREGYELDNFSLVVDISEKTKNSGALAFNISPTNADDSGSSFIRRRNMDELLSKTAEFAKHLDVFISGFPGNLSQSYGAKPIYKDGYTSFYFANPYTALYATAMAATAAGIQNDMYPAQPLHIPSSYSEFIKRFEAAAKPEGPPPSLIKFAPYNFNEIKKTLDVETRNIPGPLTPPLRVTEPLQGKHIH